MVRKKIVGIHIPNAEKLNPQMLLEQLRYAGVMGRGRKSHYSDEIEESSDGMSPVEVVYIPQGMDKDNWSKQNIARMKSFGINASIVYRSY